MEQDDERTVLAPERRGRAKLSYSVHLVPPEALGTLLRRSDLSPRPGDLVLAHVEEVGQVSRLELPDGRRATLFPGDEIVVVYGSCCMPDQFEAEVPDDLGPCDLVTGSGVVGRTIAAHAKMGGPTRLHPMGLLADTEGRRLNLADWRLPALPPSTRDRPTTLAVIGAPGMSGTGATAGALAKGLVRSGRRVGAAKVTGTGGADAWLLADGGATPVLDVTHTGRSSTDRIGPEGLVEAFQALTGHLAAAEIDVMVLVVAQTSLNGETGRFLADKEVVAAVDGVVFAAADALSAIAGVGRLEALGHPTVAVGGTLSGSPLAARETGEGLPHVPVRTDEELADPLVADQICGVGRRIGRSA